jgi:hypothetical protein
VTGPTSSIPASQWSVAGAAADGVGVGIGVWVGVGTRMEGRCAGRGCVACVVVFFDGSKADRGMASQFSGHILVFWKAD